MAEIRIIVPGDHRKPTTVSVNGVKGESCQKLTEGIQAALGKTIKEELTEEYHERPVETHMHLRQRNG